MSRTHKSWCLGLSILLCLAFASCIAARPIKINETITPVGGDDDVDLNVGQHVQITSQNWGLGISLIILGLIEVFYGFKLIRITLFVTGFLSWGKDLIV